MHVQMGLHGNGSFSCKVKAVRRNHAYLGYRSLLARADRLDDGGRCRHFDRAGPLREGIDARRP